MGLFSKKPTAPQTDERWEALNAEYLNYRRRTTMELDTIPYTRILYIAGKDNGYITPMRQKGIQQFAKDYKMKINIQNLCLST